jgi:hypothetical protein
MIGAVWVAVPQILTLKHFLKLGKSLPRGFIGNLQVFYNALFYCPVYFYDFFIFY